MNQLWSGYKIIFLNWKNKISFNYLKVKLPMHGRNACQFSIYMKRDKNIPRWWIR